MAPLTGPAHPPSLHLSASSSKVTFEEAVDDQDLDAVEDLPRHARTSSFRRPSASGALESGAVSSLELPHTLTSERVRHRSELSRMRPLDSPPAIEPEAIELPVIQEHTLRASRATSTGVRAPDITFREEITFPPKNDDVEIAPSFPSSLAPSIRADEDTDSVAPAISAAQKAVYRRKTWVNFATLCFSVSMNGWNDGTTGPLLPKMQSYYNVRSFGMRQASDDLQAATFVDWIRGGIPHLCVQHHRQCAFQSSDCWCF